MDFLDESADRILNEVDDLMINTYFANSNELEKEYNDKILSLEFIINNPLLFGKESKDKSRLISNLKESIQILEIEMYHKISNQMHEIWKSSLLKVTLEKNLIFSILNPYFLKKLNQTLNFNVEFQTWMTP